MAKTNVDELFIEDSVPMVEARKPGEPLVHTMVRAIATTAVPIGDAEMIEQVDADVSSWVARGYRLVGTHVLGVDVNSVNVLYVLSR